MVRSSGAVWSIIGTIYDKMEYIGPEVCNAREQELLPLMEFAPFRMWYPLHTIPSEEYPDTTDGCQSMKKLALEVGDHPYARMIALYQKFPCSSMAHLLGKALASPRRLPLYELLYKKIQAASESWAIRDYGHELNDQIIHQRGNVARTLHAKGFTGDYPLFEKGRIQILAMEENPFTVLESDDFQFRIQFMVSECPDSPHGLNRGFFKNRRCRGWIARKLSQI